ncbi:N-formylglutamate amidohydrolase [Phaeobacter gallaeciensis]|uniref:N-formylglutamate amidohydrolase n=1 Tax=Phaeobacter gallaeciensis TaxID=60890 RepID=A0AAC9ZB54_9RHOB|nr:N-formylglutamate amidohydrolase [Phaeobacter gallaeciensis]AHD11029.1 N-formylglutamate amidohydrolase [Phaeobacter gallaeciensis DSM 26640]ATE94292.1 N-formylglutamate amidohydrolase [Phaeobacter gallaeciensis]ATE98565.1 N-formylglutamate amidohydrolase [Phaeobacter gallaeciensis]ATF02956.1 N-formylglutamate amidohydrolase [Phaeobacter gallaeciensis]ATF07336.1 N-formylglutamate amidohydrolase [Phaeobacter gallaeciensis]
MSDTVYLVEMPQELRSGVVFASPHSGSDYSAGFLAQTVLDPLQLRSSEDAFVDQLFAAAPRFGMPLLMAQVPRAYVDLNRSTEELDPALIEGVIKRGQNPRVASGLGVVPRVVAHGRAIYQGKMSQSEASRRITSYWRPYHAALQQLLDRARIGFGQAVLIDCHSMPHEAISAAGRRGVGLPDVVLGDRFGAAASSEVMDRVEAAFVSAGLRVARNTPFAGAYITQTYGRPSRGQHAVQVEIDRSLYMNEARVEKTADFAALQMVLTDVIAELSRLYCDPVPLAAE